MCKSELRMMAVVGGIAIGCTAMATPVTNGLKAWFKADIDVIIDSNGNVSQWNDQSGNNNHAMQGNENRRPGYSTGILSNNVTIAVIQFNKATDGYADFFYMPGIPQQQSGCTVYFVANDDADVADNRTYVNWLNRENAGGYPNYTPGLYGRTDSATKRGLFFGTGWQAQATSIPTGWTVSRFMWDGSQNSIYVSNLFSGVSTLASQGTSPSNLNQWNSISTAVQPTYASFAEILIYDRALNATERQQVEEYLHNRYSVLSEAVSGKIILHALAVTGTVGALEWQKSPDGSTWSDIVGAVGPSVNVSDLYTNTPWFRVRATTTNTVYSKKAHVTDKSLPLGTVILVR